MFIEIPTVRMVAAVAKDANYGVNAQLAALALDGTDQRPPAFTDVLAQFDANVTIREKPATGWPILLILVGDEGTDADPEPEVGYRNGVVRIDAVVVADQAGGPVADQHSAYYAEAYARSIDKGLLTSARLNTAGVRGNVQILQARRLSSSGGEADVGVNRVRRIVRHEFDVRHNNL